MARFRAKDSRPAPIIRQLFFRNVQRGPIGQVRKELRKYLPSRALLGLSFVGSSTLEIFCDDTPSRKAESLATLLIEAMEISGFTHAKNFSPETDSLQNLNRLHSPIAESKT